MATDTGIQKRDSEVTRAERVRSGRTYLPNVDIAERPDEFLVTADVPGARAEDIDVNYERGTLTIEARVERRQDPQRTDFLCREYGVGDFHRTFQIGEGIDASRIEAEVKDGVLVLHLPKAEAVRPRKIAVRAQS